ncbi:MAG: hypothetical protein A3H82_03855 [Candidatus Levybacteria bacterium RIFCSPLOWO2_02_FULL_39_26]|uniref:Uncharacterized protein n=1 Tax=Candidatus Wildermuthbacteria bacterium RIFCSPHIGHO2_12_FULL_40_12 TaxID=1802457 RepID=A0A1G2RCM6_9BACT|nr:MAG: hypothetical protein A3H82_03855 [Candidatus Levybacteria bacterium RIFCSPLOWO2_02_FULL_39_26]OHA70606.1 MAG: hypothetical protein A3F15_00505 [Candidatus Wildermuthbacteria bacterium RIFCSPHIGHO2_12_FULL_40_12]
MTEAKEEEPTSKGTTTYKVGKGTIVYHRAFNQSGKLAPSTIGEFGFGLYCSDKPEVLERYIPKQMNNSLYELQATVETHHFRMDLEPTESELDILIKAMTKEGIKIEREDLKKRKGLEIITLAVDNKPQKGNELENQTTVRGAVVRDVLTAAGYDGVAEFDARRGGMILTFFEPQKTLALSS